jgi:hypothetical protein
MLFEDIVHIFVILEGTASFCTEGQEILGYIKSEKFLTG